MSVLAHFGAEFDNGNNINLDICSMIKSSFAIIIMDAAMGCEFFSGT